MQIEKLPMSDCLRGESVPQRFNIQIAFGFVNIHL